MPLDGKWRDTGAGTSRCDRGVTGGVSLLATFAIVLVLASCGGGGMLQPVAPTTPVPDLRGTWTGMWGETPLTVVVIEQRQAAEPSGVFLGPVTLLGHFVPSLFGVVSFTTRGEAVSANAHGRLAYFAGKLTLVLDAMAPDGSQQLRLTSVEPERLVGIGESSFVWGPQGPIELRRQPM
jgi:hypothetical protein